VKNRRSLARHRRSNRRRIGSIGSAVALAVALLAVAAIGVIGGIGSASVATETETGSLHQPAASESQPALHCPPSASESVQTGACCAGVVAECIGDLNNDGVVNVADLLIMFDQWGNCDDCPADLNGDGVVNVADLLILFNNWGSCPDSGACSIVTAGECESLNGFFLGAQTTCDQCPEPMQCPSGAVIENEPCGSHTNDGCAMDPPTFGQPLSCGNNVCGTLHAVGGVRDTDTFRLTVTEDTRINWMVVAHFAVDVRLQTLACPPIVVAAASGMQPHVEACVPPGDYVLFVRPVQDSGLSCGSEFELYVGSVSCESCTVPTGACCIPDGSCQNMAALQCLQADSDAAYMGDGSSCGVIECPFNPPPGACEDRCGEIGVPDGAGDFCDCDDICHLFGTCCHDVCDDCPDLPGCDPTSICDFATGDCCQPNPTPGCDSPSCCSLVCACDPFCCEVEWDVFCSLEGPCSAAELCAACGGSACDTTVDCINNENEPCGSALNDGCAANPDNPPFGSIECGQTICGNLWADNNARDTDWFLLDLTDAEDAVEVTWSVTAEEPVLLFIVTAECPTEVLVGPFSGCQGALTTCLDPGQYIMFVAPTVFNDHPCPGFSYEATLTCDDEACLPKSGECVGFCGTIAPSGCWCDDECAVFEDCCPGHCIDCPHCFGCPDGTGCE
jgi:hypothetical protein